MTYDQIKERYYSFLDSMVDCDVSLFDGISADCLMLHSLYEETHDETARRLLMQMMEIINKYHGESLDMTFGRGVLGIMDMFSTIDEATIDASIIEKQLGNYIDNCRRVKNYDLQYGLIGVGLLCVGEAKKANRKCAELLGSIIKSLMVLFERMSNDIELVHYYLERHYMLPDKEKWCNMGLLHGFPSIIAFFLICIKEGYGNIPMVNHVNSFMRLMADILVKTDYLVPTSLWYHESSLKSGFAGYGLTYCTGCLGLISTLAMAYETIGDEDCYSHARNCLMRNIENLDNEQDMGINCFCHGNAGMMYLLSKLSKSLNVHINDKALSFMKEKILMEYTSSDRYRTGLLNGMTGLTLSLLWGSSDNGNKTMERVLLLN